MKKLLIISATALIATSALARQEATADSIAHELHEVTVTARHPVTKLAGTALVSTIAGSPLQHIGTALDVLGQLPMIQTDDGTVTVTGKGTPEIYIDGRPMQSDHELIQLRSDRIRKVELELAPGATYAGATRAVLKITTRRNFINGLSVTERASVTARRKWSANNLLDLNYRTGAWDIFASGTIARNNKLIKGTTTNTVTLADGQNTVVGSSQHKHYPSTNGQAKAGINYSSGTQSFGGYFLYNPERGSFKNLGEEWLDGEPAYRRKIHNNIRAHSHRESIYYDNTFSDKYLLHFDGDYRYSRSSDNATTTYPDGDAPNVNSRSNKKSSLWAGKLYLSFPLAKGNVSVGTQDSYTRTTLTYTMLSHDVSAYIPSSVTEARQTSAAAFASWSRLFGRFSLTAGLRYEYADFLFKVNGVTDKTLSRNDHHITPDISLGYTLTDDAQLSLSYKMTTVKPPYAHLTGSLNYVGMHEIEGGNPALKDERMHDVQLFGMWKGFMLQADFTRSIDTYAFVKRVYPAPTLQLLMQPVNINVSAIDLYLIWSQPVKAWTPNLTLGMHKQWLTIDGTGYNRPIFSYDFNNTISLPQDFIITLDARGQTGGHMHTNRFATTWFLLDASVSKSFLNKSLQLKLSATDIFNTRNNNWTMNTCGVYVDKRQSYDTRGISLTLTYSLHPRKSNYKGKAASAAELHRL